MPNQLKVDVYKVLRDCVERGVSFGHNRAYKHSDQPGEATIKQAIQDAVMEEISEFFKFDETE